MREKMDPVWASSVQVKETCFHQAVLGVGVGGRKGHEEWDIELRP